MIFIHEFLTFLHELFSANLYVFINPKNLIFFFALPTIIFLKQILLISFFLHLKLIFFIFLANQLKLKNYLYESFLKYFFINPNNYFHLILNLIIYIL